ncbi:DUF4376 domain-containing protein [Vibrio hannami]|uniref:DUF4376 domain-containing protein n=1 Tax=Vibrio hannami TaxID=2717094 RepID=UPI00240F5B38|nr:DUF4376 domain-containing protein [Vibrio hannami]MDG3089132.1 DUF4376 domain-containing protein [Vibrio hannami]
MIVDNELRRYFEHHPINKELEAGVIQGSFFEYHEDGALPDGLFEITDEHDYAVSQSAPEGKQWVFDEETQQPVLVSVVYDIDEVRQAKHAAINLWRDAEYNSESATVTVDDIPYDADPASLSLIEGYVTAGYAPDYWIDANNDEVRPFTLDVLKAVHVKIMSHKNAIHARQHTMKAEIAALNTVEEIQTYAIGWPEGEGSNNE